MNPNLKPMSDQQRAFVDNYVTHFNATQAAITAGYSPRSATAHAAKLLKRPDIAALVAQRLQQHEQDAHVTTQWVINRLVEVVHKSIQGAPKVQYGEVVINPLNGEPIIEWSPTGATKALELLGRHLAMFTDKAEVQIVYRSMIDQAIAELESQLADTEPTIDSGPASPISAP